MDADTYEYSQNIGKISADIASKDWFDYEYVSVDFWDYWSTVMGKGKVSSIVSKSDNENLEIVQQHSYTEEKVQDNTNENSDDLISNTDNNTANEEISLENATVVYEDSNVKISFAGISAKGVEFWVENLTNVNITIQADSVSVNGVSTNDIMMSDDVAPQSKGKVVAKCDDFIGTTDVENVGGQLRIIDFNKSFEAYDATFVNIPIE